MAYRTGVVAAARLRPASKPLIDVASRGMATEKQIYMRIVGTKNISKITKSMKMVSASKLRGDQSRLEKARPFNQWTEAIGEPAVAVEKLDLSKWPKKNLLVALTSDKGLCGGVNSVIARSVRNAVAKLQAEGKEAVILSVGEKGRSQLTRSNSAQLDRAMSEIAHPYTFSIAMAIAVELSKHQYDAVHLVYNKFKSAIAYEPHVKSLAALSVDAPGGEPLIKYEFEPDVKSEVLQDLNEYLLASQLYYSLMEGATSEQSSRMNAMENASKNAGEMIESLTLQYNRARQSRITTELIEIISGAAALDKKT